MRNLDTTNPSFAKPKTLGSVGALLPFLLTGFGAFIASEATPLIPILDNALAFACLCLCGASIVAALVPRIFKWDWRIQYFGFSIIYLASTSLIGVIPWLSVVLYSSLPIWVRLCLFVGYATPCILWCGHFITFYRTAFADQRLQDLVYEQDDDAIYYMQQNDKWLTETKFKLRMFPSNTSIVVSFGFAFLLIPFMSTASHIVGIPFIHIFLMVFTFSISMAFSGLAVKGFLVFYYYPWRIRSKTGKEIFVDMGTRTARLPGE